ncbi:MAG: CBS domain-containing protein [Dokdonella sp.]|uniref:CBS domain-containing protein n=1 Tax=Dokdonella sp. TaxID=2291710 RepID=UPI003F81C178
MQTINQVMTPDIVIARPDQTIADAARMMAKADIGSLPVGDDDRLVGMLTDRDIVVRAVAKGLSADTPVREVMTDTIRYCYDDQSVAEVARNMAELGVRRLPVVNRDKRIVGFVALSNIAQADSDGAKETLLRGVATPH